MKDIGFAEEIAEKKAIEDFGDGRKIGKALQKSIHPSGMVFRIGAEAPISTM
jgi:hypothetical protein